MLHGKQTLLKLVIVAFVSFSMLGGTAWSQRSLRQDEGEQTPRPVPRKKVKGPRALAVIEIAPNGKSARLVPITILVGDQWFDAGLYMASPVPMALESQTVYEGETAGESAGLFTVTAAQEIGENWFGVGTWKPKGSESAPKKVVVDKPSNATSEDEDRPVLRRSGSSKPSTPPTTSTTAPAAQASATPPTASSTSESKSTETQPGAHSPAANPEENSNRPTLRRGAPGIEQAESIPFPTSTVASKPGVAGKPGDLPPQPAFRMIAAISDAGGPEPRSYVFHTNPGERQEYTRQMIDLASKALQKFVAFRFKGAQAPVVTAENSRLSIFDISSNNEPVLILTVRIPASEATAAKSTTAKTTMTTKNRKPPQPVAAQAANVSAIEYDATIVARVAVTGELRKLFDSVTDSTRLDAYPRLDLIDAVDANGDSVGELLFRETYDRGHAYVLYRVGMDQLWPLFEGSQR
jgi:hypothetical protein